MKRKYQPRYERLKERYYILLGEVEKQLKAAGAIILERTKKTIFQIDLSGFDLFEVGEFDPKLRRRPHVRSIIIHPGNILLHLELQKDPVPFEHFETLSIGDELEILDVLEKQIDLLR